MIYSEAAFYDGAHVQHIADWQDYQFRRDQQRRLRRMARDYFRWEKKYTDALQLDVRNVIERADRASKGPSS